MSTGLVVGHGVSLGHWRRSVAAVPVVIGGVFAAQTTEYLLFMNVSVVWYHVINALVQGAVVLCLLYLHWGWQDQAKATQQAYERLADLERLRDRMTAMLIHDLRNPLTAMGGALGILLSRPQVAEQLGDSQKRFLTTAASNQRRLARMVDDIVDVVRSESGELPLEFSNVELCQLAHQAVQDILAVAESKQLKLLEEYSRELTVCADADKLRRVLDNFLTNAVRFTPPEGEVQVSITPHQDEVWIAVQDTGDPLPDEVQQTIFDTLGQASTGVKASIGLSLPFCKIVAQAHGGRVWAEPGGPDGNRFVFALPVAPTPSSTAQV